MTRKSFTLPLFLCTLFFFGSSAHAAPRDAEATLNRCGRPLKGDLIVYDNAGGHRSLQYERGTIFFLRVGNDGWTFDHGEHKNDKSLDADAMAKFMPCLQDALADSASPEPLKKITSVARMETSLKRDFKAVLLYVAIFLALLGAFFYWLSSRPKNDEDLVK